MYRDKCLGVFDNLFNMAKEVDEFEYICSLMRIRLPIEVGWDPLEETQALFNDLTTLIDGVAAPYTRLRLLLMLYCHITEADSIYIIIDNLLSTIGGKRCNINPFSDLYRPKNKMRIYQFPPSSKSIIKMLKEHAELLNKKELIDIIDSMFNDQLRNAFFHSDYILYKDEMRSRNAWFLTNAGISSHSINLSEVESQICKGTDFYQAFIKTYLNKVFKYKENKMIKGRFGRNGEEVPIEILADKERGLYGFRGVDATI